MRSPIIAGNWKMHCDTQQAVALANGVVARTGQETRCTVVLCPPATVLERVAQCTHGSRVKVGAQNFFWEDSGAYTGEISAPMIRACGAQYVLIGHSERRGRFGKLPANWPPDLLKLFSENDMCVNRKVKAALQADLLPIVCCGELASERQEDKTDTVVTNQVRAILEGLSPDAIARITIAYEPIWAIGTGEVCEAPEANRVCGMIRALVSQLVGQEIGESLRILYGGSIKPNNIEDIIAQPEVDGGLVGGAALQVESFATIVDCVAASVKE